jgi:hypothetical protein
MDEAYLQEAIDRTRASLAEPPAKKQRPSKGVSPATAARRSR